MQQDSAARKPDKRRRIFQAIFSIVVVVAIFGFALPKFADFSQVWTVIGAMTWIEIGTLVLVAAWNIATYWQAGVAHRDIKPSHILVRGNEVFLIDVALSRSDLSDAYYDDTGLRF